MSRGIFVANVDLEGVFMRERLGGLFVGKTSKGMSRGNI